MTTFPSWRPELPLKAERLVRNHSLVSQLGACHFSAVVRRLWLLGIICLCAGLSSSVLAALTLYQEAAASTDLVLKGELLGLAAGEKRFVRHADLLALPTTSLKVQGEFSAGIQEVTALFLSDLWAALPCSGEADTFLATCSDGYSSIYRRAFVKQYRPFMILRIDGQDPENWAVGKPVFNPGPYVITLSADLVPAVATLLDASHKRPWGVTELEVANYAQRFHGLFEAPWSDLSAAGKAGREIWVNSCYSCHQGPPGAPGGTKSDRPFTVLALHASLNPDYFKKYIRSPQAVVPTAKMEKHDYSEAQFADLIAFISADGKWKPGP